jgi:hypothetical protein
MLGVVGVPRAAAGVKAQPPHGHSGVLSLFRHLGLDKNRFGVVLVGGQLCQQLRPDAVGAVGGHYGKIIQLAHPAALRPHHQKISRQRVAVKHAPCVGGALRFAGQDHAQGLQLPGGEVPAHLFRYTSVSSGPVSSRHVKVLVHIR